MKRATAINDYTWCKLSNEFTYWNVAFFVTNGSCQVDLRHLCRLELRLVFAEQVEDADKQSIIAEVRGKAPGWGCPIPSITAWVQPDMGKHMLLNHQSAVSRKE